MPKMSAGGNGTPRAAKMSATNEKNFSIGDIVWAKMRGFPCWPGRIVSPKCVPQTVKEGSWVVFFFGSRNYAVVEQSDIVPFLSKGEDYLASIKSTSLKRSAEEAHVAHIKDRDGLTTTFEKENGFEEIVEKEVEKEVKKLVKTPVKAPVKPSKLKPKTTEPVLHNDEMAEAEFEALIRQTSQPIKRPASKSTEGGSVQKKIRGDENDEVASSNQNHSPDKTLQNIATSSNGNTFVSTTDKIIGFIGLGTMGSGMVTNLLQSGHNVVVWNRTDSKCAKFVRMGAKSASTPAEIVAKCDITISCISDPAASKEIMFGSDGVLKEMDASKSYIEMTSIDVETSKDIAEAINIKHGRYLEAQIQGSKVQSESGSLIVLAAGDRTLFDDAQSCFKAIGTNAIYLGEVGNASKMNIVLQGLAGVSISGLAEAMAFADRLNLNNESFVEALETTHFCSPFLLDKCKTIIKGTFLSHQSLELMQKDLRFVINLGDTLEQPLPVTAAANEVFKHAKKLGYRNHDASAVFIRSRY